jgi:hypothetical protein
MIGRQLGQRLEQLAGLRETVRPIGAVGRANLRQTQIRAGLLELQTLDKILHFKRLERRVMLRRGPLATTALLNPLLSFAKLAGSHRQGAACCYDAFACRRQQFGIIG